MDSALLWLRRRNISHSHVRLLNIAPQYLFLEGLLLFTFVGNCFVIMIGGYLTTCPKEWLAREKKVNREIVN